MKKLFTISTFILFLTLLCISCNKVCTCGFYVNDVPIFEEIEAEKYEKSCIDQSSEQQLLVSVDSLGMPFLILDSAAIYKCK